MNPDEAPWLASRVMDTRKRGASIVRARAPAGPGSEPVYTVELPASVLVPVLRAQGMTAVQIQAITGLSSTQVITMLRQPQSTLLQRKPRFTGLVEEFEAVMAAARERNANHDPRQA